MSIEQYVKTRPGVPQREIAAALGISRAFLNQLLNAQRFPSRAMISKLEQNSGGEIPASSWFEDANKVDDPRQTPAAAHEAVTNG